MSGHSHTHEHDASHGACCSQPSPCQESLSEVLFQNSIFAAAQRNDVPRMRELLARHSDAAKSVDDSGFSALVSHRTFLKLVLAHTHTRSHGSSSCIALRSEKWPRICMRAPIAAWCFPKHWNEGNVVYTLTSRLLLRPSCCRAAALRRGC